ncbi:MAG TPA: pitrilysin family protein [Lentimicrobium sp.]|nr:pitrilysin family protein [Lentimicrobium sp.]
MSYQFHTLSNGIRIVHRQANTLVGHLALMVNTGTRDEEPSEAGLAHFIEHMIFKGTNKRKLHHVLGYLENIGADLNAYTTKEETCIHASFTGKYYSRAFDLFSDILTNSTFPEKEIEKEKDVVIDEINGYKDSPAELIFDEFEEMLFKGHPLGKPILATPSVVRKISRKKILSFISQHYNTDQIVISSVGNLPFSRIIRLAEKYFGTILENRRIKVREPFTAYEKKDSVIRKPGFQTHCIIGAPAYSYSDKRRTILALLTNILGGPAMNSRLSMALREKSGISYNIESAYTPYCDTGSFMIYLGIDNGSLDKAMSLVNRELAKFREKRLGIMQLHLAKQQFAGQLAISFESNLNDALSMAKSVLVYNTVDIPEVLISKILAITSEQLMEVANEILNTESMSSLIYLNKR